MAKSVFVGIDVAFAKEKILPVAICERDGLFLKPMKRRLFPQPRRGKGNKAALDQGERTAFAEAVMTWLNEVSTKHNLQVERIAIDAPSDYCRADRNRRAAEQELDARGISVFATPTERKFERKIEAAEQHLADGGAESEMPNANQIWMLIGFQLFRTLEKTYECIEVYPQATVRALGCDGEHKSTDVGFQEQIDALSRLCGISSDCLNDHLKLMCFGEKHDKLDAYLSAWVASFPEECRLAYGEKPHDVIWVPNVEKLLLEGKLVKAPSSTRQTVARESTATDIDPLLERSSRALWASYAASVSGDLSSLTTHVVFPRDQRATSTKVRVSEQEARAIFAAQLESSRYLYSVEVPTVLDYRQRGEGERSALLDLCVYESRTGIPSLNMEFKEGGCSTRAADSSRIGKDLEKLLHEKIDAVWFHTLEAVDSSTIPELLNVIRDEIRRIAAGGVRSITAKSLRFHICILRHQFAIQKSLETTTDCLANGQLDAFFRFGYRVSRNALNEVNEANGWKVMQPE